MELITINNDVAVLDASACESIAECERMMAYFKAREDELKKVILEEMEAKNIIKIQTDNLTITYIASSDRETFDSKAFKADNPDIYDAYVKLTKVKPSVRIKVK